MSISNGELNACGVCIADKKNTSTLAPPDSSYFYALEPYKISINGKTLNNDRINYSILKRFSPAIRFGLYNMDFKKLLITLDEYDADAIKELNIKTAKYVRDEEIKFIYMMANKPAYVGTSIKLNITD